MSSLGWGVNDNFSTLNGMEITTPSPALSQWINLYYPALKDYDDDSVNSSVAHTFDGLDQTSLGATLVGATLEYRAQALKDIPENDSISLRFASGASGFVNDLSAWWAFHGTTEAGVSTPTIWQSGDVADGKLDLDNLAAIIPDPEGWYNFQNLSAIIPGQLSSSFVYTSPTTISLISTMESEGVLDVTMSDDTNLDFLKLNVHYQGDFNPNSLHDFIQGFAGDDTLEGFSGNDLLFGDEGNDILIGDIGNDILLGGLGNDSLNGDSGNDTLKGDDGNDSLNGGIGNDRLFGGTGKDTLLGSTGNDTLNGEAGNDSLNGGANNDILNGGVGDDKLDGNRGNDMLTGGAGQDILTGGTGQDTFVYNTLSHSSVTNYDVITDYKYSQGDTIDAPGTPITLNSSVSSPFTTLSSVSFSFGGNSAAAFTVNNLAGTFIALDNGDNSFNSNDDAVIFLQNYSISSINQVTII